jgi:ATP/maltotriose-dependent transcriptional regulator MalT
LFAQAALGTTRADWDAVVRATAEMMQIADALDDKLLPAFALEIRGVASWGQGDLGDADISFAEATKVASQAGLAWQESFTRAEHARLLADRGELSRADELAHRALAVAIAAGEDMPRGFALDVLAVQARNRGDVAAATALAVESLACYEAVGYQEGVASALQLLALTDLERGDLASAQHRLTQVFDLHRRLGHRAGVVSALEASARLHALQGDDMRAASLLWTADRLRDEIGVPRPVPEHDSAERLRQEITARLGTRADAARRNGLTLDLDAAVLLAAGVSVPPGSSREQNS